MRKKETPTTKKFVVHAVQGIVLSGEAGAENSVIAARSVIFNSQEKPRDEMKKTYCEQLHCIVLDFHIEQLVQF